MLISFEYDDACMSEVICCFWEKKSIFTFLRSVTTLSTKIIHILTMYIVWNPVRNCDSSYVALPLSCSYILYTWYKVSKFWSCENMVCRLWLVSSVVSSSPLRCGLVSLHILPSLWSFFVEASWFGFKNVSDRDCSKIMKSLLCSYSNKSQNFNKRFVGGTQLLRHPVALTTLV